MDAARTVKSYAMEQGDSSARVNATSTSVQSSSVLERTHTVSDRGRILATVVDAYRAAIN